jgi:hypothetical protein
MVGMCEEKNSVRQEYEKKNGSIEVENFCYAISDICRNICIYTLDSYREWTRTITGMLGHLLYTSL